MHFKIHGVSVRISFFFLAFAALSAAMSHDGAAAVSMLLIVWHELGHIAVIAAVGGQISAVNAKLGGFEIVCKSRLTPIKRAAALAGGVMFNGLAGIVFKALGAPLEYRAANLILFFFNMLPISALDGGQLLELAAAHALNPYRAQKICRIISVFTGSAVLALGIYIFTVSRGISVAVFAIYLIFTIFQQLF